MKKLCTDAIGRRQTLYCQRGLLFIPMLAVALFTAGCGSSSSTSSTGTPVSSAADTVTGLFLDTPVQGLDYTSGGASGVTDAKGTFRCVPEQQVTFSVENITLGTTQCASVVTPLDLVPGADAGNPQVQAIASFLQSMDGDGNSGNGVIDITSAVRTWLSQVMTDQGASRLNLTALSSDHVTAFTQAVVAKSRNDQAAPAHLAYVPPAAATANLEVAMASADVFRKNISDAPGLATDEVSLDTMDDIWVTPQRADGGAPSLCDSEGSCVTPATVNPLLAFYLQPPDDKTLAKPFWGDDDAWVAVSLDDGATWKRTDLSQSADKTVPVGDDPYADVNRIKGVVEGNKALVTWVSTYCPSTDPMDLAPVAGDATARPPVPAFDLTAATPADLRDPAVYNTYDIFGVSGAQGMVDYGDPSNPPMMYRPEVGKVAYHCIWAARGVFDSATQSVTWYAPEQITSGVRDANLDMPAAAMSPDGRKGAFAIIWQEDPLGQNPGMGAGEGVGWGGAHTNKGTDIWYTFIDMDCFSQTGPAATANGCHPAQGGATASDGRPVPAYRMSAPVPVSDNNGCVLGGSGWNAPYCQVLAKAYGTMVQTTKGAQNSGQSKTFARSGKENPMCAVKNIARSPYWTDANWPAAMGTLQTQCDSFDPTINSVPLNGDTAASRPRLHLVYDDHTGGMRALLVYEEQKAMGFLCKGNAACQADRLDYQGKFVLFNSFPAGDPVTVDPGGILDTLTTNYMDTNHDGVGDTVRVASDGTAFRYIFENARNARLAVQDANNAAYSNGRIGAKDLRMVVTYKDGLFNMSQTSDLMVRRACGGYEYGDWGACAATEAASQGVDRDPICISCETVTRAEPGSVKAHTQCAACHSAGASFTTSDSAITAKALDWRFVYDSSTDNNLYMNPSMGVSKSTSSYDPLDDVESPWPQLAGDMVVISYAQAPNWPSAHHYKGTYDFFVRRSFDGGFSWTNAARTHQEGPVNISNLPADEIVEEPRIRIPQYCGFDAATGVFSCPDAYGADQAVSSIPLVATYCTAANVPRVVTEADIGQPVDAPNLACFFGASSNLGETYFNHWDTNGDGSDIALIAADHDLGKGAQERCGGGGNALTGSGGLYCHGEEGFDWLVHGGSTIRDLDTDLVPALTPGYTDTLHGVWLREGTITDKSPYNGIDAWYRRVDFGLK